MPEERFHDAGRAARRRAPQRESAATLFKHSLKLPVDFGMFFFGLPKAGLKLDSVGGVTAAVLAAVVVGKTAGILTFSTLAKREG